MVTLTDGDDRFDQEDSGNIAPDTINAIGGDDTIFTSTLGGSLARGGDGNDTLVSRGPSGINNSGQPDTLEGGAGSDSLEFQAAAGFGFGDDENDTLVAVSRTSLYGGQGDDFLRGLIGDNWYSANQGNDILLIGTRDSLYGGRDNDTISVFAPEVVEALDFDTLPTFTGDTGQGQNFISANRQEDLVVAFGDRDTIYGGRDNDTLYSLGSQVRLSGDRGNDVIVQLNQESVGTPVNSTAIALTSIERSTLIGGEGNDFIQGAVGPFGDGRNSLDGGAGNDTIRGQASRDTLVGGEGDDLIITGLIEENEDKFSTNGIAVTVPGFAGQNRLDGGAGNDTLASGFLSDTMIGGQGNDCLSGIFSRVDGGEGDDTIDATSISTNASGGGSIEVTLIGSSGNDILLGSTNAGVANFFDGGTGNDFIQFGGTSDQLIGNTQGNDTVIAFQGGGTAPFFIEDTQGSNTLSGGDGGDTLITGAGDDSIVGGTADDSLGDSISAGAGDDVIFGRGGTDTILAGAGDDYIAAGLNGTGDSLIGGQGNDSFAYFAVEEGVTENSVIVDFDPSDDRILLDLNGFNLENSSKNSIIGINDFAGVGPGDNYEDSFARTSGPTIIYERNPKTDPNDTSDDPELAGSGLLKYDPNGNLENDDSNPIITIARLNGTPNLLQSDIFII
ncbi:MAG: calcium-binding protein [Okeania sp. SIO2G4]|uniref:calcium-binding protein n=1 Tax=unclassified Okeania TaxID=2634635 RepID=UPI0013B61165|nr:MULTISPECIES: calcium-binding protein [unclassified Okeania]NEP71882.1 calcium-binding protein [Okeania sp. SIO2G5]NEP92902.1 calcium-binding protein [Okeania sp. SIO2F5]NEQ90742.1 calcium-binding protein [Okeania sp. SIO2G4]